MPELAPLPEPAVKAPLTKKEAKDAQRDAAPPPEPAAISKAPMMIPVVPPAAEQKPLLPPSVTERMEKTFATEPKQQGIIRDVKTVKNPIEVKTKPVEAKPDVAPPTPFLKEMTGDKAATKPTGEAAAPVTAVDEKPLLPAALPSVKSEPVATVKTPASVKPVEPLLPLPSLPGAPQAAVNPDEMPKLPEPVKAPVDEAQKLKEPALPFPALPPISAPKQAEPMKPVAAPVALPQPPVLPMPMPLLGSKPEAKSVAPEKLPPAELPLQKAEQQPITLPKTEIATLPKMDAKPAPVTPLPELPKPPVTASEPAKKEAAEVKKSAEAPKLAESVKSSTTPALPELPKLPVVGIEPAKKDAAMPSVAALKPAEPVALPVPEKDGKPALPTLPKLPMDEALNVPEKLALPSLTPIIGEKPPSSAEILQPKDGIEAKPLMANAAPVLLTSLPKFPSDASPSAKTVLPALPSLPPVSKPEQVKLAEAKLPEIASKPAEKATPPALPLPAVAQADADKKKEPVKPLPVATASEATRDTVSLSVSYSKGKSDLGGREKSSLDELAEKLKKSQATVRIVAYASGTAEEVSVAKRTSLARALQIRAHLIDKGVNPQTISTQALGNKVTDGNADRADVFVR